MSAAIMIFLTGNGIVALVVFFLLARLKLVRLLPCYVNKQKLLRHSFESLQAGRYDL